jgi:prepilin-type N-terminal cleavage/methylation domain-containing protein
MSFSGADAEMDVMENTRFSDESKMNHLVNVCDLKKQHRAFTLLELLVVIAIITILAGLLFPAFQTVQNSAKKTQAKNDLTQIVTAVNAFYTEYGKYPTSATSDATATYGPAGSNTNDLLLNELRAKSTILNTRQIVFISPQDVKDPANPRSGIGITGTGAPTPLGQFWDPWGTPYNIEIDWDYNNQIANPYPDGSAGATPLSIGVISWSYGSDQTKGTKSPPSSNFKGSDDVISWQ